MNKLRYFFGTNFNVHCTQIQKQNTFKLLRTHQTIIIKHNKTINLYNLV